MSNPEVNNQDRIIGDPSPSPNSETLSVNTAQGICAVCGGATARKYCSINCYRAWQRSRSIVDRFWSKVAKGAGCWLWTGSGIRSCGRNPSFYGQFIVTVDGESVHHYAHRVSWELAFGPIPQGKWVLHKCDEPRCVNPEHLFLGDHLANMQDAAVKKRLSVPRQKRQKVTAEQLIEIDALLAQGILQKDIAARYGVTKGWVSRYVKGSLRQYDRPVTKRPSRVA